MFHCDEDYLSSIGGIEHNLVLNHLGGFPRMASQTRWVNTNSWENSFKSLFSHNAWFGLMGTFQKSLLADTLQTKKISICQFLRDGELWNSRWCWFWFLKVLNLDAKTFESNWSSAPISLAAILAKKTNLKCKAFNLFKNIWDGDTMFHHLPHLLHHCWWKFTSSALQHPTPSFYRWAEILAFCQRWVWGKISWTLSWRNRITVYRRRFTSEGERGKYCLDIPIWRWSWWWYLGKVPKWCRRWCCWVGGIKLELADGGM